ncbi:MAG TPA: hypothetical protein VFQ43_13780, partial [Nitrososphaera sp.]|nr:hypothetical protein [Nitrososphaera sp.]
RDLKPPFKFDIRNILSRLRKLPVCVDGVTINLPGVKVTLKPDQVERTVAREVVIRLADRRVLNARECCDGCIENALKSLQEIRQTIVDKQVELSSKTDGVLFLLLDSIRDVIRQFLTFEQRLTRRSSETRELYFAALEMLRAHIHRSLLQISKVADMEIPGISAQMRYDDNWQLEAYKKPLLLP